MTKSGDDFRLTYLGLLGDVNHDDTVSIADVTTLVNMILSGNTTAIGDANRDRNVTIADVPALVNIILNP